MNRDEICLQLTGQINRLKDKENTLTELLPDIRLYTAHSPARARR